MTIHDCRLTELDMTEVGTKCVIAVITARQLGHTSVYRTTTDYWHNATPASEFVRDLFTSSISSIVDKWLGGDINALEITKYILNKQ